MRSITRLSIAVAGSLLLAGTSPARAEDWPQWRGPHFDGSSTEKNLPDTLDPKAATWATTLPGSSSGTPVVSGDKIFLPALDRQTKKLLAVCCNRSDGKIAWSKEVALGLETNQRNDLASPSPIADGQKVIFYFGTGDVAAFDYAGNPIWSFSVTKQFGKFNMNWIYSASPLLFQGKLYVPVLHRDVPVTHRGEAPAAGDGKVAESYLLALDPATGSVLWRVVRPTDAIQESREAYTTPIPMQVDGKWQIIVMGGDHVTGHDAETGKELWRSPTYDRAKRPDFRTVTSAVTGAGLVFGSGPKDAVLFAIKPGQGDVPWAWESKTFKTDVEVPLFYQDKLFVLNGDGRQKYVACLDPATGDAKWQTPIDSKPVFRASPTGADGKIYCMNESAEVWVFNAADGKQLSHTSLGTESPTRSSIVVADGQVLVRTSDKLYAFKK
jgi:outer membrane protein assembly factor BamB